MEKFMKLQASIFGDFKSIDLLQEPFGEMYQKYLAEGLMPSVMREFDMPTQTLINRPSFVTQDNSLSLLIFSNRVDVITDYSAADKMLGLDEFVAASGKYLSIFFDLFQIDASRLSFITEGVSKTLDSEEHYGDCFLNMDKVYNKDKMIEWSANSVSRVEWDINGKKEKVNLNVTSSLRKLGTMLNGEIINVNGLILLKDINTLAENVAYRFKKEDLKKFLDLAKTENDKIDLMLEV